MSPWLRNQNFIRNSSPLKNVFTHFFKLLCVPLSTNEPSVVKCSTPELYPCSKSNDDSLNIMFLFLESVSVSICGNGYEDIIVIGLHWRSHPGWSEWAALTSSVSLQEGNRCRRKDTTLSYTREV